MSDLRVRAQKFLERPYPLGAYAEDNLTDGFIRRYIDGRPWDDPELQELLRLCYVTAEGEIEGHAGEARAYFQECAEVLRGILIEIYGSAT
jgi:hypothetical protein